MIQRGDFFDPYNQRILQLGAKPNSALQDRSLRSPAERGVRPTADGRANGSADEPRWLRPPAAVEPADGTDGPAGHGSPADPLGLLRHDR